MFDEKSPCLNLKSRFHSWFLFDFVFFNYDNLHSVNETCFAGGCVSVGAGAGGG